MRKKTILFLSKREGKGGDGVTSVYDPEAKRRSHSLK